MVIVNLANNLSVRLTDVVYQYSPRRWFSMIFVLYPTVGKAYADGVDVLRQFPTQWHEDGSVEQEAIVTAFLGQPVSALITAVLGQYTEFDAGRPYNGQFTPLFTYIKATGIVP
jgi:hypothetical protein